MSGLRRYVAIPNLFDESRSTFRQAVFPAIYTTFNARVQGEAVRLSSRVTYLTDEEADAAAFANDTQIDRAWAFRRQRARGSSS